MQERRILFYLFAWVAAGLISAAPAHSQTESLLDRLENRVRERLSGDTAPQPTTPPNLESPPLQSDSAAPDSDAPPTLGLEAEERGTGVPYEVVVNVVRPGTPAAEAGMQPGDVILSVDGRRVGTIEDISSVLQTKRAGDSARMVVRRGDRQMDVQVNFATPTNPPRAGRNPAELDPSDPNSRRPAVVERPPSGSGRIGVTVENASTTPPGAGVPVRRGAVVVAVAPGSPADVIGIRPGNVIVAVDGRVIQNAAGLIEEVGATVPGQQIELSFYRGESLIRMPLHLAGQDGLAAAPGPGEARLGPPSGATPSGAGGLGGPGAAGDAPTGLLGGLGQAIGGMFGGTATPPAVIPGAPTERPAFSAPPDAAPETRPEMSARTETSAGPLAPLQPVAPEERPAPLEPVTPLEPATPAESAAPPADAATEIVPLPAGGPDEIRQLLDKMQAMQRRIDVLERRLTELEAEKSK